MAVITNVPKEVSPNAGLKIVHAFTAAGDSGDTTTVDLKAFGISSLMNVLCQVHTTDNSVLLTEEATTAVAAGVLTVTLPAENDGKKRSILIVGV